MLIDCMSLHTGLEYFLITEIIRWFLDLALEHIMVINYMLERAANYKNKNSIQESTDDGALEGAMEGGNFTVIKKLKNDLIPKGSDSYVSEGSTERNCLVTTLSLNYLSTYQAVGDEVFVVPYRQR